MNSAWKEIAERGLASSGLPRLARRLRRSQAVVLAYHNVVPDDFPAAGDRSLHLSISSFRAQLDELVSTHEVVSLDSIVDRAGGRDGPRAVLTFDDAYRGALELALPATEEYGVPATLFVAPDLLGEEGFWWDLLARRGRDALDPRIRRRALSRLQGRQDSVLGWARERGIARTQLPALARPATREEVLAAARSPGISIGSHSWSHTALPTLDTQALEVELAEARSWLAAHVLDGSEWLAYPYGLHNAATRRGAEAAGYAGAVTGDPGWTDTPANDRFAIPRVNIPAGVSKSGFRLRVSGVPIP